MAKFNKKDEEHIEDEDYSSEDFMVYKPTKENKEELEGDEDAYKMLEYIEMEWPSLTIDSYSSKVIVGTAPQEGKPELISIEIKETNFQKLNFQNLFIEHSPNKIRVFRDYCFALSDTHLTKYSLKEKSTSEVKGSYGFGLCVCDSYVIAGRTDGFVEVYDHFLKLKKKFKASDLSIECVSYEQNRIVTGSTDHTVRMFTLEGEQLSCIENDSEINALEIKNNIIIFGDDNGKVHKYDLTNKEKKVFEWHNSPISFIRWKDSDVFASGSDEQVCIWDLSIQDEEPKEIEEPKKNEENSSEEDKESYNENEIEVPVNLLFVHQGQKNYKDCCFSENRVITTSEEGLCIFEPLSFFASE